MLSRDIGKDMLDYLPRYYTESHIVRNLTARESEELDNFHAQVKDVLRQFFIDTATWGLARWEEICGIAVNETKPVEQRRSVIKSKLRGAGTVTLEVIKNVVDSFENGLVAIEENFANYEVIITFIGKRGIPPNLQDVKDAVREIVPAHLNILYQFTYLRWNELDAADLTWDELESMNMSWDKLEVWKP